MSDNTVRQSEAEDGGAVYSVTANADTENMIATAAEFHGCKREAIIATAISIYVAAFNESLKRAITARDDDDGPRH